MAYYNDLLYLRQVLVYYKFVVDNRYIRYSFKDYSVDEMLAISEREAGKRGFTIEKTAKDSILDCCELAVEQSELGNGRFCRNMVENAILNYANRVYGEEVIDNDYVLREADFMETANQIDIKEHNAIGFRA